MNEEFGKIKKRIGLMLIIKIEKIEKNQERQKISHNDKIKKAA